MKKKSASALAFFNTRVLTAHRKQSATRPCRMPALLGALLCAAGLLAPGKAFSQALKPDPAGIMDLPGSISADEPIGTLDDHPWLNPNVDGLRMRTGWNNSELSDEVYNWVQIDESLANAAASGKFIGLGVTAGINSPPWLLGGVTFTDGETTSGVATLTSATANFVTADVGRVIRCDLAFPPGTTIVSIINSTVVQTSARCHQNHYKNTGHFFNPVAQPRRSRISCAHRAR